MGVQRFKDLSDSYPLGVGSEVGALGAVMFLISEKSNWITGTNLRVDGGFSIA